MKHLTKTEVGQLEYAVRQIVFGLDSSVEACREKERLAHPLEPVDLTSEIEALEVKRRSFVRLHDKVMGGSVDMSEHKCETVGQWRSFATAPEDGTEIIAWRDEDGVFVARCWDQDQEKDGCWFADGDDLTGDLPTLWMPLPPEPNANERTQVQS